MKRILIIILALACVIAGSAKLPSVKSEADVQTLISTMTLSEKIGQLNQLSSNGYTPQMCNIVKAGEVGSLLNEVNPEVINTLQHDAVENSRLGIPLIFARDVIHGFKTIFPIPLGQAATWDPELVEQGARVAADEATSVGIRWTFSPMLDISRDGRWGRIAESFGEDPVLTARLGAAMVKGYQGDDLSKPGSMAACVKHFAGYGASESGVDYKNVWLPLPLLRDVYLPGYKAAIDAGAASVMTAFNDINGIPASGNSWLLRDVLRSEWDFDGVVVSDWNSSGQMINQGFANDLADCARISANAGMDIDMESHAYASHLQDEVEAGRVSVATIDQMVANVLRLKMQLGLFENPYVDMSTASRFYTPHNLEMARRCARESAIMLDNKGVLPLDGNKVKTIAVIGPMAHNKFDQNGTWAFDMEKSHTVTPLEAFQTLYGKDNVLYARGLKHTRDRSTAMFDEAVKAAELADVVVLCIGEEAVLSGEAHCRADISLPGAQSQLLTAVKSTGKPLVMVIMAGRPLTIVPEVNAADATLFTFHGGTMAGEAIADIITGKTAPSGHLPVTMPKMVGQLPLYYNSMKIGRPAQSVTYIDDLDLESEQISTDCESFYLDAGKDPAFPFGFGLTYTTFEYGEPRLSATEIDTDGTVTVSCSISNTGKRAGVAVPQLYICDKVASLIQPVRVLKDFKRIDIAPAQTVIAKFTLRAADLGFTDADGKYIVEPGDFDIWVAPDAASGHPVLLQVK